MITKTYLINTLDKLPEQLAIDELIDHLIFIEKVQKGITDSENSRVLTKDQAKRRLKKWLT